MLAALILAAAIPPLSPSELEALCAIAPDRGAVGIGTEWEVDPGRERDLSDRLRALPWKELPRSVRCGKTRLRLQANGYGEYVNSFALSPDGRTAAIGGGFQAAPLLGGGGSCLYRLTTEGWRREACLHEWDS